MKVRELVEALQALEEPEAEVLLHTGHAPRFATGVARVAWDASLDEVGILPADLEDARATGYTEEDVLADGVRVVEVHG